MKHDDLFLWFLADPETPRYVGRLRLVEAGKGVSLQYGADWLASGFPLSEDLILTDVEFLPRWKGTAVGAVDAPQEPTTTLGAGAGTQRSGAQGQRPGAGQ